MKNYPACKELRKQLGLVGRQPVFEVLQTTKAQTSLLRAFMTILLAMQTVGPRLGTWIETL